MKEEKRYAGGIVLAVAVLLIVLSFAIPEILVEKRISWYRSSQGDMFLSLMGMMFCVGLALVAAAVVLFRKLPLIEANKPMSIILFLVACPAFGYFWPLWLVSSGLCIYYLTHLKKTNGKKGTAITMLVLSVSALLVAATLLLGVGYADYP